MDMSDEDFVRAFELRSLPPGAFDHSGHIRLAWIYLQRHAADEALHRFAWGLRRYAAHLGVPDKYHETITWALFALINQRMAGEKDRDWEEFQAANPDLFEWPGGVLGRYYSRETLNSDMARRIFVMPDPAAAGSGG